MAQLAQALVLVLAQAAAAAPESDGTAPPLAAITEALMAWVSAETRLAAPPRPCLVVISDFEMTQKVWGDVPPPKNRMALEALYEHGTGTIYLREGWDGNDVMDRSRLLHELVHHFQEFHHIDAPCRSALEPQAYELQVKWLQQNGVSDGYGALGIDEATVRFLSICPDF